MEDRPYTLVTVATEGYSVETLYCNRHYAERRMDARAQQLPKPVAVYLYGAEAGGLINYTNPV